MIQKKSRRLIALSTTALALPGIAPFIAVADSPPTQSTISYKFSNYQEDALSRSEVLFGDLDRYDIDIHQFQLITPIGDNWSLSVDANQESMSGASPWFTTASNDGSPIINLSGASGISDTRSELAVGGRYYLASGSIAANIGYSEENDYRAKYVGFDGQKTFNNDMTTLGLGFSYSSDDIFPTDAVKFNRIMNAEKNSKSMVFSVSQIINQTSTFQSALSITEQSGFLSDPYKLLDVRPEEKTQIAWSNAYRHFIKAADAALHINYRYYRDDFGIDSHTLDFAWHQNINRYFQLIPKLRYYSQSAADFYTNIDDFSKGLSEYQSSDYRLSSFGAVSGGLSGVINLGDWSITIAAERYIANEKYASFQVQQVPAGLVKYSRLSVGIDYTF